VAVYDIVGHTSEVVPEILLIAAHALYLNSVVSVNVLFLIFDGKVGL
jgi:hypothetical protein